MFRFFGFLVCIVLPLQASGSDVDLARQAVVKIETTSFAFSYQSPWKQPSIQRSSGTGFVIEGRRILTNAHVVSQVNTLRVKRPNQLRDYKATVKYIAHDCDLALLEVEEEEFFEGAVPLAIGGMPELQTPVVVVGFPVGGDRVSLTRGIISRMGMDLYSHSGIDSHLTIQVDAAINSGNSGGPALQDGKVIGVAFQVYTRGENLGYLIPPVVVRKFLIDIEDGSYDGYIDLGIFDRPTENELVRKFYGLDRYMRPATGVVVYRVLPGGSADGHLQEDDVILSLNGHAISESGDIELDGHLSNYVELIDNLSPGSLIKMKILRAGKEQELSFPARRMPLVEFQRRNYDYPPEYLILAGLLFQPIDASLLQVYSQQWSNQGAIWQLYRYGYFLSHRLYQEVDEDVVLSRRLSDASNLYAEGYEGQVLEAVNGQPVKNFRSLATLLPDAKGEFLELKFRGISVPLVLKTSSLGESTVRVLKRYGIQKPAYIRSRI